MDNFTSQDLKPVNSDEATEPTNLSINTNEAVVMTGVDGKLHDTVYDLALGTVSLEIQDTSVVSTEGNYTGNVNWNLENENQEVMKEGKRDNWSDCSVLP